ncbi:MAG: hypothetical protein MK101_07425 [Phycisphaerales bacterium]|nr:hypothetical protein [Phycisphaerales bacterium]
MTLRSRITTIVVVSVITLLIWLVAEGRTRDSETFPGRVQFVVAAGDSTADFTVSPAQIPVQVSVSGPASAIREARTRLRSESLRIEVTAEHGRRELNNLTDLVAKLPSIRALGVEIVSIDPTDVVLDVEERVPRQATIRPLLPAETRVEDLTVDPLHATIYVLRPDLRNLPDPPLVEAIVDPDDLSALEPGGEHTVNATLRLAGDASLSSGATIDPPSAAVRFRLLGSLRQTTVDTVRVMVVTAPEDLGAFKVSVEDKLLDNVEIEADPETIDLIESGMNVFAVVYLKRDDLEKRIASKQVAFLIALDIDGPGRWVQIVGGQSQLPPVNLTIETVPTATSQP